MEKWQFNVLYVVGVGGAVFLVIAPAIPMLKEIPNNPGGVSAIGLILTFVLTQKDKIVKKHDKTGVDKEEGDP